MPASQRTPDPAAQQRVFNRLNAPIRTRDDLLDLFVSDLGFTHLEQPIPVRENTFGRGQALEFAGQCQPLRLAGHNGLEILYAELDGDRLDYTRQRVLATQLLRTFPDALFVFACKATLGQPEGAEVHLVNAKGTDKKIFRRFKLGCGENCCTVRRSRYRSSA